MTFWLGVAVVYAIVLSLGLTLGRYLAERFPGRDQGGGRGTPQPAPVPPGPSHARDWMPPGWSDLGSAFDRALLPGAFNDSAVSEPAARTVASRLIRSESELSQPPVRGLPSLATPSR